MTDQSWYSRLIARRSRDGQLHLGGFIQPMALEGLHGLVWADQGLIAVDPTRGLLVQLDTDSGAVTVLNPWHTRELSHVTAMALQDEKLWLLRGQDVLRCDVRALQTPSETLTLETPFHLSISAEGLAVGNGRLYLSCQTEQAILTFDLASGQAAGRFDAPGIGAENLLLREDGLWVCDRTEETVYCLDPDNGAVRFSVPTPAAAPTGLTSPPEEPGQTDRPLLVAYASEEHYIQEIPNAAEEYQLAQRARTFVHPLSWHREEERSFSLSNGYLVELCYVEEIDPLESFRLEDVAWHIALPCDSDRQKLREVSPIGHPFEEISQDGQRVAVFRFENLDQRQRRLIGWRALVQAHGIKYQLTPEQAETGEALSDEMKLKYLVDDDGLAMDTQVIRQAAQEAVGDATLLLDKVRAIREFVYRQLTYRLTSRIAPPDVVLRRGVGSCGEYVGVLLALLRLNGIAARTVGRYKCPPFPERMGMIMEPDYNHVWIEFFIPGIGWLPMESNPDDLQVNGRFPQRFFMGLAWYHVEIGKGIPFQTLLSGGEEVSTAEIASRDLSVNHIRFRVLGEREAHTLHR